MVADKMGFDPDETKTIPDNPFWDGTDGAHPAWWRGEEYGCKATMKIVLEWLIKPLDELRKGTHYPEAQALKERILELRTKHKF